MRGDRGREVIGPKSRAIKRHVKNVSKERRLIFMTKKFLYGEMTWPEIRDAAKQDRVAIVPVATLEDHGPHLPVDTDNVLCWEVCKRAGALASDEVIIIPPVLHGYSPHHMDFPGAITIGAQTFVSYVLDVCKSLACHGFKRILIVNGHGSNTHLVESVARLTIIETEGRVLCAAFFYWNLARFAEAASRVLEEKPNTGGHADEMETSMYLAIRPDVVDMSKAPRELRSPSLSLGPGLLGPIHLWSFWSTHTESGIMGDATLATKEKGEKLLEAAAAGLADVVRELKKREIPKRVDHH